MKKTLFFMVVIFMLVVGLYSDINWDGGQRIGMKNGDTAICQGLREGQLYGVFFYNQAGTDKDSTLQLIWSNSAQPVLITVPGTTGGQGLATVALVSGTDTNTITVKSLQIGSKTGDYIETWIGSVSMPINTSGLDNEYLPADGKKHAFNKYRRYYNVPASKWYTITINSNITQFISVQFMEKHATVYICNPTMYADASVVPVGSVKLNQDYSVVKGAAPTPQTITYSIQGNGYQMVWMDADSPQDTADAWISLQ